MATSSPVTIEQKKITLNSISIIFRSTVTIAHIRCYCLRAEDDHDDEREWHLFGTKQLRPQPDMDHQHVSFHFLELRLQYKLVFYAADSNEIMQYPFECTPQHHLNGLDLVCNLFSVSSSMALSADMFDLDYDRTNKQLHASAMSLAWLIDAPHEWNFYVIPNHAKQKMDPRTHSEFLKLLLMNGLFALPSGSVSQRLLQHFGAKEIARKPHLQRIVAFCTENVMLCPHPLARQIIDLKPLKRSSQQNADDISIWARNKKLKRHRNTFYLSVNFQFKKDLKLCQQYHVKRHLGKRKQAQTDNAENADDDDDSKDTDDCEVLEGTWLTDEFIEVLCTLKQNECKTDSLRFLTFELWDKDTQQLLAAAFSYVTGSVASDYTFMTLRRDHRSCGNILTKVVGHMLASCGYDLWWWGFKLDYMDEYDKYGGTQIERQQFAQCMRHSCQSQEKGVVINRHSQPVLDIIEFAKTGKALIQPLPQWLNAQASKVSMNE